MKYIGETFIRERL